MKATIRKPDGERIEVEAKQTLLEWQKRGLMYTASGYGKKIPTSYMVRLNNRWRRVYCTIYSNSGTCYIEQNGARWIIESVEER
jgi:hypothetical protein